MSPSGVHDSRPGGRSNASGSTRIEHDLAVGRAGMAIREDRHQAVDRHLRCAHRPAVVRDRARAFAPRRARERGTRARSERSDGEQECDAERDERAAHPTDEQPASRERPLALERVFEGLAFLRSRGERVASLDERPLRHERVGPQDQPGPEARQRDAEQNTLGLRLPTRGVHAGEAQRRECRDDEAGERDAFDRHARLRAGRVAHVRVPIQRITRTITPSPMNTATAPSTNGPRCQRGLPPRSSGSSR